MSANSLRCASRADLAALLCVLGALAGSCPPALAEEELGRLFFTPERRQSLDRQRQFNIRERQEIAEDPTLTVNGVVTRSSGKRTVWINGVAQNENERPSGVAVTPNRKEPGKIVVQASDAPPARAKVGDTINRNSGESADPLGGGRISVNRGAAR
jgi:hypothetical protein